MIYRQIEMKRRKIEGKKRRFFKLCIWLRRWKAETCKKAQKSLISSLIFLRSFLLSLSSLSHSSWVLDPIWFGSLFWFGESISKIEDKGKGMMVMMMLMMSSLASIPTENRRKKSSADDHQFDWDEWWRCDVL